MSANVLNELKEGNNRFTSNSTKARTKMPKDLAGGQSPHTIVLTCSDSRVPPEVIFDQDLGDLFVIRIAGNTASDEAIGSIEYAAANLGSSVCLVLGHSNCGAVGAAIDCHVNGTKLPTSSLESVVEPIMKPVAAAAKEFEGSDVLPKAVHFNVKTALNELIEKSPIVSDLKNKGTLSVMGAVYDLETGVVNYID